MNDGGPAFPIQKAVEKNGSIEVYWECGLTLRDYFAGKAMQSILLMDGVQFLTDYKNHAKQAYEQADAMLAERNKS